MTAAPGEAEALRAAFAARAVAAALESCPPAERIWQAAGGALDPRLTREVVDHLAVCAACAEAWRLAADLQRELGAELAAPVTLPAAPRRTWAAAVAAVVVLSAGGILATALLRRPPAAPPAYRAPQTQSVRSLVPEERPLDRDDCRLRWSGPEGSRYDLLVSGEDLRVLQRARGLVATEYRVPSSALAHLPPGTRILWQVEAILPDGERLASATFVQRLD